MKKIIGFLVVILIFSTIGPSMSLAAHNKIKSNDVLNEDFKLIVDTDELSIFQVKESDGHTYEYVEKVSILPNGSELLLQEKYLVADNEQKQLVDTKEIIIDDVLDNVNKTALKPQLDNFNTFNKFNEVTPFSSSDTSGGSLIADVRWIEYTNGMAHAIAGGQKVKYIKKTVWQYRDFRAIANELKGIENDIVTLGVIGIADALIAAIRKGELLSWTLLKKVAGKAAKAIPGLGTLYTIYDYGSTYLDAQDAWRNIPE